MALYKKEVLVRPNSPADFEDAMNWTKNWLMNTFQDDQENIDEDGNYIDYFFADVTFAPGHSTNGGQVWRIFTPPCEQKYSMTPDANTGRIEYQIADLVGTRARLDSPSTTTADTSMLRQNRHQVCSTAVMTKTRNSP